jgi:hypothetical protein
VQGNYYLPLNISFYYPDFEEMEIRKKTGEVKFRTNDSTEKIMTGSYREYTENLVFSKKSEINSISLNGKKIIQVDLNRKFIDDTKLKSIREGMVLQSIVNTFGNFFGYEQVRITIDGKEYRSNHISLNNRPLAVNFISYPLFYDVVVYGGTASGVMSAVAASREGAEVALIEPSGHIGGMVTGGLSYTDRGNISVIGGITKEFFQLMGKHYGEPVSWDYEPHAAEEVLNSMADKENIDLYLEMQLKEENGVQKDGARITHITLDNEDLFYGQIFIDSSYEGDLMAMSDVSYTVGREGKHEYGESFAGKLPPMGNHDFFYNLTAYDDEGNLFKEISLESPGTLGQGDNKVQSYTYRLCLTDNVDNMIPFTKPDHYDSERYELLAAWIKRYEEYEGKKLDVRDVIFLGPLPNGKYDMNNNGPFSSDYVGGSWEYPDGDYDKREAIKKAHKEYIQGLLYFLSTDELVPPELRSEMKLWGYTADEFKDNGYWPYQLYIREARRMMGDYVMTQDDLQEYRTKGDSIGMGSYNIDSHNVHRYFTLDGYVQNEGDIQVAVSPYEIPYRVLVPKKSEAENLLVTVCVSASHVAYSSMRMEPQYMIMGEAAGIAAWISIDKDQSVQDIDVDSLRDKLKNNKGILELGD